MRGRTLIQLMLAVAMMMVVASPARAGGAEVSSGEFLTLPGGGGLGYDITGTAVMRRAPGEGGKTIVTVQVRGLNTADAFLPAGTVYPVHVHNAPCSSIPAGGGHYQDQVGGEDDAVNEIWPAVTSNSGGNGYGFATHANWARPDAMSVVIHYPPMTSIRLACADLG